MCNKDKWTFSALWQSIDKGFMRSAGIFLALLLFAILLAIIGNLFFKVKT